MTAHATCNGCGGTRPPRKYLCRTCWFTLPADAQGLLKRRDRYAFRRLAELHDQLRNGIPLGEIEITTR